MSDADKKKKIPNPMPTNILSDLAAEFIFSAEVNLAEIYSGLTESFRDQNE